MSTPGQTVTVTPADLVKHAATVDAIGDQVDRATQAATHVQLSNDAYGLLCQGFPLMLAPMTLLVIDALQHATSALHESATKLRATATDYTATDDAGAQRLRPQPQ
jgi:hypothetical protein